MHASKHCVGEDGAELVGGSSRLPTAAQLHR